MAKILTNIEISQHFSKLIETPSFIETLNTYEKDEVLKYTEKRHLEAVGFIYEIISHNPNYHYPENDKENPFEHFAKGNSHYKEAKFVIDLINKSNFKSEPKQILPISFPANFSDPQLQKLFNYLNPNIIETDIYIFKEVFTGIGKSVDNKITWKPIGRNKHPNIKALLDLFYITIEYFNISITDKVLFKYLNTNFIDKKGKDINPKTANKSNPPKSSQSELYYDFEKLFKTL